MERQARSQDARRRRNQKTLAELQRKLKRTAIFIGGKSNRDRARLRARMKMESELEALPAERKRLRELAFCIKLQYLNAFT
jgi:hypothetical protein